MQTGLSTSTPERRTRTYVDRLKHLDVAKTLFWSSCVILLFGYGVVVGRFHVFPYALLKTGAVSVIKVRSDRETVLRIRPTELLRPARYAGKGVTRVNAGLASPGLTLVFSFFDGGHEVRLMRLDGAVVHRWPMRFFDIFKNLDYVPSDLRPKSEWNVTTLGGLALPDGSVVVNFLFLGTVKLNRCGAVEWIVPQRTHHSVTQAAGGGFWIPNARYWAETSRFPVLRPPFEEHTLLKVSDAGEIVGETSILDVLFKNNLGALLFDNGLGATDIASYDILHLNDAEELSEAMAPSFPMFAAGDLLVSLRSLNLLMVVDPRTQKVKWHQTGPWIAQHDPDFQPNGTITVFSNNNDRTETGSILGGSTIIDVNPATGVTTVRYGGNSAQKMFTGIMGSHQFLANGNLLITETEAGRVFEVDARGSVVWEFINRHDESRVAIVTGATRYPDNYFTVRDWTCH